MCSIILEGDLTLGLVLVDGVSGCEAFLRSSVASVSGCEAFLRGSLACVTALLLTTESCSLCLLAVGEPLTLPLSFIVLADGKSGA